MSNSQRIYNTNGGRGGDGGGSTQIYFEELEGNNLQLRQHIQNLEKQIKSMK